MTFEEYKAKTEEMVNEVSDLCMTAVVTDQMSLDEVISYYKGRLNRIYDVCSYPEPATTQPLVGTIVRRSLDCRPFGNEGLVRCPAPGSPDWIIGQPGELFEELREMHDGKAIERRIIRVVDGKEVIIWQAAYAVHGGEPIW